MKTEPKVEIIIPVYNAEKHLLRLTKSLLNLNYKNYRIIFVIDKKSKDNSEKILNRLGKNNKKIKVIKNNKKGSAANRNRGFLEADKNTKYLAFTDSDCYVDKNWLRVLVDTIENSPKEIVCVGGINLTPKTDSNSAKLTGYIEKTNLGGGNTAQTKIFTRLSKVKSIPNCNALYRKKIWEINKQDESLIVGQDGEFNYRLSKQGLGFLINPKARVWHHRPNTLKKYFKRMYKYGKATTKIFYKHKGDKEFLKTRWYGFLAPIFFLGIIGLFILDYLTKISLFSQLGIVLLGAYLITTLITSLAIILKYRKPITLITPIVLIANHLLYSWGVIEELFN